MPDSILNQYDSTIVENDTTRITEGSTQLIVPTDSLKRITPPRNPAFFNPRAKVTRDLTLAVCGALPKSGGGPHTYLDAMAGTGARGLRVATELDIDRVIINDINPKGIEMARRGSVLNRLNNVEFRTDEACGFLSDYSIPENRGDIVDVDPFGSPAPYMDCALRATSYDGIIALTATDLMVLGGVHSAACRRIYGGVPIRTVYGSEIALRLILGCMSSVAGRLGKRIAPLYVESHMHYYRTYVTIHPNAGECMVGYIAHCYACGYRHTTCELETRCSLCGEIAGIAGPLWVGRIFDERFVTGMLRMDHDVLGGCYNTILEKCRKEATLPATFYTLDEVASRIRGGPPRLVSMIQYLGELGFNASPTSLSPSGFRTDASMEEVCSVMTSIKS